MRVIRKLNEKEIIRIMKEEWSASISRILNEKTDDLPVQVSGADVYLTPELKVVHKKSGYRYTIDAVGPLEVDLRTPEGKIFTVSAEKLENEYAID